jgi:adenosine deaminase
MHGGNGDEIGDAMVEAIQEGERRHGVSLRLIPDIVRNVPYRWADKTVEWALDRRGRGVVGLGLSGVERGFPAAPFRSHFEAAAAAGLHCTAHAGELAGPRSIREVLLHCHAERIGHGVRSIEDAELLGILRDGGVPLEVCPTSNLRLGVYPDLLGHPFHRLYREGLRVTVNSDDPTFFDTTITGEYARLVAAHGYGPHDVRSFVLTAAAAAFASPDERGALEQRVRSGLDAVLPPS